jgi:hypothetical protein
MSCMHGILSKFSCKATSYQKKSYRQCLVLQRQVLQRQVLHPTAGTSSSGRYFIQPPPGSPDANNRDVVYEVCSPLYGNPSSPRALHKTLDAYFVSEGFEHVGFEESVWVRPKGGKYGEDIYVSTHVDDCLISCKSTATMSRFKQELLTRFQGTDEGEVNEYLRSD